MRFNFNIKTLFQNLSGWRAIFVFSVFLVAGGLIGWIIGKNHSVKNLNDLVKNAQFRLGQKSDYTLINPLLGCGISDQDLFTELKPLKEKVSSFVDRAIKNKEITRASIYFREINNGVWTGINENDKYIPASLVKLPLMISYYKYAESKPDIFNKVITFSSRFKDNLVQVVAPPPDKLLADHPYSIRELLRRMVIYSDNDAYHLLSSAIEPQVKNSVYSDLGLKIIPKDPDVNSMSTKSFSSFFRALYNATYLSRKSSNDILEELTHTNFKDGIVAGLPDYIETAHKFGERTIIDNNDVLYRELHDCGIIYYPDKPYLLCVMTQGSDFNELKKVISGLSSLIYHEISKGSL